jgi:hypothetical protein
MFEGVKMMMPPSHGLDIKKDSRWKEAAPAVLNATSNVLDNLKSNLNKLEELHSRLQYMLGEIKILIRK